MHPAHKRVHESIFPVNTGFIWQSLCTKQYSKCHQKLESMKIIRSFDHMVQITPAAARPNPFAGHFPFPAPELNHLKKSQSKSSTFSWSMINQIQRFGQAKHKPVWKIITFRSRKFSYSHSGTTFRVIAVSCNYIHLHAITFWISFDNSSKESRNPLPTWSLPDACTSVLARCFHFTLSHSCCPFFFEKVCLVANGPRYILSAFSQCNLKAISWQISTNGACMVILLSECITPKLLFHWFIAFLSQASLL